MKDVFTEQNHGRWLFVRTIGMARLKLKVGLANLAYNIRRAFWLAETRSGTR